MPCSTFWTAYEHLHYAEFRLAIPQFPQLIAFGTPHNRELRITASDCQRSNRLLGLVVRERNQAVTEILLQGTPLIPGHLSSAGG